MLFTNMSLDCKRKPYANQSKMTKLHILSKKTFAIVQTFSRKSNKAPFFNGASHKNTLSNSIELAKVVCCIKSHESLYRILDL